MKISEIANINEYGTYAGLRFSKKTIRALQLYQKENDIQNPTFPEKFHVTLLYSRKPCYGYNPLGKLTNPINARFKQFEIFETQPDENNRTQNCLVMELDCEWLINRQKELVRDFDATFDYDEYRPHITLSYNAGDVDPASFPEFTGLIELVEEYQEKMKPGWN